MSLTRKQIEEIATFDLKKRQVHDFDGRRYGSVTGRRAPHLTEAWCPCHGSDLYNGKKRPTRKTLRYNYIVPDKGETPDVTVVHVAVRLNGAYRQVVKEVGRWHIKTGKLELRDIDYHGLGGWIVDWQEEDWAGGGKGKAERSSAIKSTAAGVAAAGGWRRGRAERRLRGGEAD